jgi:hypothetical protein
MGTIGTSVTTLAVEMLKASTSVTSSQQICSHCDYNMPKIDNETSYVLETNLSSSISTSSWVANLSQECDDACAECLHHMIRVISFNNSPYILIIAHADTNVRTSHRIKVKTNSEDKYLYLRGIIYYGDIHFTSRIISTNGDVWYHDGMTTGSTCHKDSILQLLSDQDLKTCRNKQLHLAIYAQK